MNGFRTVLGATLGGTVALVALRVRREAQQQGASIGEIAPQIPSLVVDETRTIAQAARGAVADGRQAAARREREVELYIEGMRTVTPPGRST